MDFSATQCRAARALLNWSQTELGKRARVDTKTVADYERGVTSPHFRTLEALAKVFEAEGVVFLEASETYLLGVALRPDSEAAKRLDAGGSAGASGEGDLKALAWDEDAPVSAEAEELRDYWRDRPEAWAALPDVAREALLREMQG